MFYLSRRQAHAALAAAGTYLAWLAAAEVGSKRPVRVAGLFIMSSVAMAGLAASRSQAKAVTAHKRIDGVVTAVGGKFDKTGGTISGAVTVDGDHHVLGNLYGSGGNLAIGDYLDTPGGGELVTLTQLSVRNNSGVHTDGGFFGHTTGDSQITASPPAGTWYTMCHNRVNDILTAIG